MTFADPHVTKCRLCGQPPTGLEGLCADCTRALTRARQGPAALRDAPAHASKKGRRAIDRIVLTAPSESDVVPPPGQGRLVLWAVVAAVTVVTVLVVAAGLSPTRMLEPKVSERATRIVPPLIEPANQDEVTDATAPAASRPPTAGVGSDSPSVPGEGPRALPTRPARTSASASTGTRSSTADKSGGDASRASGLADPAPEPDPPVQQARTNVASTASSGDDSHSLANALEKCSQEKFLASVICEQKARLRYCEGKWGQVPQCSTKPRVD